MGVVPQILTPRVQHTEKANRGAQMLFVRRDLEQGGRTRAEQQIVDDLLVVKGEPGEFVREREHHMAVADRQELRATLASHRSRALVRHFGQCRMRTGSEPRIRSWIRAACVASRCDADHGPLRRLLCSVHL
jgi:hypothetical protein